MSIHSLSKYCDRTSRRAGANALSLLRLHVANDASGIPRRNTAVIFLAMDGGHRPFQTIDTRLPGVQFSEFMAKHATVLDRMALLRAIHHEFGKSYGGGASGSDQLLPVRSK